MPRFIKKLFLLLKRIESLFASFLLGNKISLLAFVGSPFRMRKTIVSSYTYVSSSVSTYNTIFGKYCCVGPNTVFGGLEHLTDSISTSCILADIPEPPVTTVGHDVWIGANVFVRSGCSIGTGSVVGAGSIVLNDVPPYSIVVGCPAKVIRYRYCPGSITNLLSSNYWELRPLEARSILQDLQKIVKPSPIDF